jgi:aryl-alcohol dehydrogenase-like predicted oxidoreductase
MEYVGFGKTGRIVSRIGFGGAVAGLRNYLHEYDPDRDDSRRGVVEAIGKAVELGITYFDTAPGYGEGRSEAMFGEALASVDPGKIFLATKLPFGDRDQVFRSVEESLRRLRRDSVDLIQIHGTSYSDEQVGLILQKDGMLEAMEDLKRQGVARYLGFTTEDNNDAVYALMRSGRFDAIQMCYNLLFQHPYEPSRPFGSLREAEQRGLGIVTMRAPTSGTFQRWIRMVNPDNTFDYTRALIQFVLSNPCVDVALIGMRTARRVIENVEICDDTAGRIDIEKLHTRYV